MRDTRPIRRGRQSARGARLSSRRVARLLSALLLLLATGCAGSAEPPAEVPSGAPSSSAAIADLDRLLERLESTHPAPFHGIERSAFVADLRALQKQLPDLTADQATVGVMRLVAELSGAGRDGHQFALPQPGHEGPVLPLRIYEFEEGVHITAALEPYADLAGAQVVSIGGHPIAEVLDEVDPLVPRDGPATVPAFRPVFLLRTEVLRGLGLVGDGAVDITVRSAAGEERDVPVDPVPFDRYAAWAGDFGMFRLPERADTRYLVTGDEVFQAETVAATGMVYLRYPQVQRPAAAELQAARDLLSDPGVARVILDIRQNPGGDNHNNPSIVSVLTDFRETRPSATVVVLIDRVTFSAAANLATDLERIVDPVYVGEAMGGGLNFWNDVTQVRLDNLPVPMQVGVSTRYWERSVPDDPRLTIEPDIPVPVTAADYFAGRDPALVAASGMLSE